MTTKYNILSLNHDAHKYGLVTLWKAYIQRYFDGRFEWLYNDNPAGITKTVLAISAGEDEIVGCSSIAPHPLFINGKKISAGIAIDFLVHENHRTYGPALKLQRTNFSKDNALDFKIILAFPNKAAKGPILRAGCKELGESRSFTKILKTGDKLVRYLKFPAIAKPFGFLLDKILSLLDCLKIIGRSANWHAEIVNTFDERFDAFWNSVQRDFILADRSAACLNWRYAGNRNVGYQVFCLNNRKTKALNGYVVYFEKGNVVYLEDMFAMDGKRAWIDLLCIFSIQMRQKGAAAICVSYFGSEFLKRILRQAYFFEKQSFRTVLLYINENVPESDKEAAMIPENWCLFEGDLDL